MSIADLNTLYAAAVAAMDASEWDTAILKLMAAKARLATTPNLTRSLGGGGSQQIAWNASEIDTLIGQCRQQKAAGAFAGNGPFLQTKVTYERADTVEE